MNKFDLVLMSSPELGNDSLKKEIDILKKFVTDNSGKLVGEENWGLRDLTYNINKFKKAFYNYFQIEIDGSTLPIINKNLNQSDNILRYLFVKVKDHQSLPTKLVNEKK